MFPRRSCAIKNSLGAPFLRKEMKEKKGDKPRNPSPEPEGARKSRWNTILFLRRERQEKYGNKPWNPSWNKNNKEGGNHDGTQCHNTREASPGTLPGTRWNQDMLMEQTARRLGRQSPEPYPKPKGLRKWWWNRMPEYPEPKNHGGTKLFLGRVENPVQLQSCLGNKPRKPSRNQERMMEQSARKYRETSPGTQAGTRTWWWNRMPKE